MKRLKFQLFVEQGKEEHAHGEVAQHHHVGDGLHDVPRGMNEGATHDKVKLVEEDRAAHGEEDTGAESSLLITHALDFVESDQFLLSFIDQRLELRHTQSLKIIIE